MSECKHCEMESSHCHYCCDGAQIDMLEKENAELRKENHEIPTLKNRIRDLLQGIEGYKGNNNRYHSIVAKLLNYDKIDISIHHAKGMLEDLRSPIQLQLEKENAELRAKIANLSEITTPMKAECMGEFRETYEVWNDLADDYIEESRVISWTNMKDIYQMMLKIKLEGGEV